MRNGAKTSLTTDAAALGATGVRPSPYPTNPSSVVIFAKRHLLAMIGTVCLARPTGFSMGASRGIGSTEVIFMNALLC
jgi:hypothetical protein